MFSSSLVSSICRLTKPSINAANWDGQLSGFWYCLFMVISQSTKLPIYSEGGLHFGRGSLERSRLLNCLTNSMSWSRLTGWGDASLWKRSASCDSLCKIPNRSYPRALLNFMNTMFATIVDSHGNIDVLFRPIRRVIVGLCLDGRCLIRRLPCRQNDPSLYWIFTHSARISLKGRMVRSSRQFFYGLNGDIAACGIPPFA